MLFASAKDICTYNYIVTERGIYLYKTYNTSKLKAIALLLLRKQKQTIRSQLLIRYSA